MILWVGGAEEKLFVAPIGLRKMYVQYLSRVNLDSFAGPGW